MRTPDLSLRDIDAIGYDETIAREQIFASARAANCEIVVCQENEIQLDIDKPWPFGAGQAEITEFHDIFYSLDNHMTVPTFVRFDPKGARAWKSRHGNTHIVLTLRDDQIFTDIERVLIASCLGSDPVREVLNLKRIREGSVCPVALFKPLRVEPP